MPLVVADAGPLHYLVPTGDIELLPKPLERVLVPQVVGDELANAEAPQAVRDWIARAPSWLDVRPAHPGADDVAVAKLDEGERAAQRLSAEVIGVDVAAHLLRHAAAQSPHLPLRWVLGQAEALALSDQAVDRVLMSLVIYQIAHRRRPSRRCIVCYVPADACS
jgi:hypothetical protein